MVSIYEAAEVATEGAPRMAQHYRLDYVDIDSCFGPAPFAEVFW